MGMAAMENCLAGPFPGRDAWAWSSKFNWIAHCKVKLNLRTPLFHVTDSRCPGNISNEEHCPREKNKPFPFFQENMLIPCSTKFYTSFSAGTSYPKNLLLPQHRDLKNSIVVGKNGTVLQNDFFTQTNHQNPSLCAVPGPNGMDIGMAFWAFGPKNHVSMPWPVLCHSSRLLLTMTTFKNQPLLKFPP